MFLSWNEDGEAKKIIYLGSTGQVRGIVHSSRQESAASDSARGQEGDPSQHLMKARRERSYVML